MPPCDRQARRGLCRAHGGCARPLRRAARPGAAGGVLRRGAGAADRRDARAGAGACRPGRPRRLRVPRAWAPPTCSSPSTTIAAGARFGSPTGARRETSRTGCVSSSTSTIPTPRRSASSWTTLSTHSAGRALRDVPAARATPSAAAVSSSTSRPSTQAGSTWSRSRWACCAASASTVASASARGSKRRSTPGNDASSAAWSSD